MPTFDGTLVIHRNGQTGEQELRVSVAGEAKPRKIHWDTLDASLRSGDLEEREGTQVSCELPVKGDKPKPGPARDVRPKGSAKPVHARPVEGPAPVPAAASHSGGTFVNPYTFVPAPPREPSRGTELGDRAPVGHHRFHPDRWSGQIRVVIETVTPLLIPDAARTRTAPNDHKVVPLRMGHDGRPYLPPTSVKGMLRAAYEAVTNSRFGVWGDHSSRLAYRSEARSGLRVVPARIVGDDRNLRVELLPGTTQIGPDGEPPRGQPMYAAWLPCYGERGSAKLDLPAELPSGARVKVTLRRFTHRSRRFDFWRVAVLHGYERADGTWVDLGDRAVRTQHIEGSNTDRNEERTVEGWVHLTNRNIGRKHDERVFFTSEATPRQLPLDARLRSGWRDVIRSYRAAHDDKALRGRRKRDGSVAGPDEYLGPDIGQTAWSRHLYEPNAEELTSGTTCYAKVRGQGKQLEVIGLVPVMIARELFEASPEQLLRPDHQPARTLDELSPADRVFGWVNGSGSGAYRGALRVGPVVCATTDAVERFDGDGVPLAILGEPKPAQGRFYAAADPRGTPFMPGVDKQDLYARDSGLRGRKVYLHHGGLPEGYWQNAMEDRTQVPRSGGQEYRRPDLGGRPQRDNQNRSVTEWVRPGTRFETTISVQNLSGVELGALLWLLQLPDGHHHRMGGAKPLGFGSVTLRIDRDRTALSLGRARAAAYRSLGGATEAGNWDGLPGEFEASLHQIHEPRERVGILESFLRAAAGPVDDGVRVHYPRVTGVPDPEGKQYEWFTANDRGGQGVALPAAGEALPLHDGARRAGGGGGRGGARGGGPGGGPPRGPRR